MTAFIQIAGRQARNDQRVSANRRASVIEGPGAYPVDLWYTCRGWAYDN